MTADLISRLEGECCNCGYAGLMAEAAEALQAREGGGVGWRWRFDNDLSESMWFYGHVIPERPENAINTIVETQPLYTHPATPSADKLRIAVEGIDADYMTSETHHPGYVLIPTAKFDAIVAALKAEGA